MEGTTIILDLNGTVVDTEIAYFKAYEDVLEKYNIPFSIQQFTDHWSTQGKKLGDYLKKIGREDLIPHKKEMLEMKDKIFQSTLGHRAKLMPNVIDTLKILKENGFRIGLDSSTTRENINIKISHYFDVIACEDMTLDEGKYGSVKKKTSRLKYLADTLGCDAHNCIVIGDAEKDIKGAKEAGMKAIAVPNEYTKNNDFSLADKVLANLSELNRDVIKEVSSV